MKKVGGRVNNPYLSSMFSSKQGSQGLRTGISQKKNLQISIPEEENKKTIKSGDTPVISRISKTSSNRAIQQNLASGKLKPVLNGQNHAKQSSQVVHYSNTKSSQVLNSKKVANSLRTSARSTPKANNSRQTPLANKNTKLTAQQTTVKSANPFLSEDKNTSAKANKIVRPALKSATPTEQSSSAISRGVLNSTNRKAASGRVTPKTVTNKNLNTRTRGNLIRAPQKNPSDSSKDSSMNKQNDSKVSQQKAQQSQQQRNSALNNMVTKVQSPNNVTVKTKVKPQLSPGEIKARSEEIYREHLFQTFQAMKFVQQMPPADPQQLKANRVFLSKRQSAASKRTIIFDLDETLVHCCDDLSQNPDVVLPVTFPTGEVVNAGINIRPYARECLTEANKYFEVIVFTASHRCYADVVLDYLDPQKELIHHRLYRESCVQTEGIFIKDLRILGNRNICDMIIVDNAAYSFGYHIDNGIPIISWHDDPYDKELFNLMDYLKLLAETADIREVNRNTFHLDTFYEDYLREFITTQTNKNKPNTKTHKK